MGVAGIHLFSDHQILGRLLEVEDIKREELTKHEKKRTDYPGPTTSSFLLLLLPLLFLEDRFGLGEASRSLGLSLRLFRRFFYNR